MTVPISNVPRRVVLAASGTGPYSFNFEILAASDIAVYRDDTLLTLTTDYTVTINTNGTGSVTLTASPGSATQIAIVGDRTIARATDFTTGGDLFASSLNEELDQQTIFNQQNAEGLARSLKVPVTDPVGNDIVLPSVTARANKYLAFDGSGNPLAAAGTSETSPVSSAMAPVVSGSTLSVARAAMGLGTMSTQNGNNVSITGGTIAGITDLAVADGGTGRSALTANNVILGDGTNAVKFVAPGTTGNVLTSNGTTWESTVPAAGYTGINAEVFTANGTFTIPAGITKIKATVIGGGGGGRGSGNGGAGGNSSLASGTETITTVTGNGGGAGTNAGGSGAGGSATNGDLNFSGSNGGVGSTSGCANDTGGGGGSGAGSSNGESGLNGARTGIGAPGFLGGGGGTASAGTGYGNGGASGVGGNRWAGGGGGAAIKWLTSLTPGNTLSVTVGAAGTAGTGGGYAGSAGIVLIEW